MTRIVALALASAAALSGGCSTAPEAVSPPVHSDGASGNERAAAAEVTAADEDIATADVEGSAVGAAPIAAGDFDAYAGAEDAAVVTEYADDADADVRVTADSDVGPRRFARSDATDAATGTEYAAAAARASASVEDSAADDPAEHAASESAGPDPRLAYSSGENRSRFRIRPSRGFATISRADDAPRIASNGGIPSLAPSSPPLDPGWHVYALEGFGVGFDEEDERPPPEAVAKRLRTSTHYTVHVEIANVDPLDGELVAGFSPTTARTLETAITSGANRTVITPVVIVDRNRFLLAARPDPTFKVDLRRMRRDLGADLIRDDGREPASYGGFDFTIETLGVEGPGTVAISLWQGLTPLDEIVIRFCVEDADTIGATDACFGHELADSGTPGSLLFGADDLGDGPGATIAGMHLLNLGDMGVVGVMLLRDAPQRWYSWPVSDGDAQLRSQLADWQAAEEHHAEGDQVRKILFPGRDRRTRAAEEAFDTTLTRYPRIGEPFAPPAARPRIWFRYLGAGLDSRPLVFPAWRINTPPPASEPLGYSYRVLTRLPHRRITPAPATPNDSDSAVSTTATGPGIAADAVHAPGAMLAEEPAAPAAVVPASTDAIATSTVVLPPPAQTCIDRWLPVVDDEPRDPVLNAATAASSRIVPDDIEDGVRLRVWDGHEFPIPADNRATIEPLRTQSTLPPSALVLLGHYGSGVMAFNPVADLASGETLSSAAIRAHFEGPSFALLLMCNSADPGFNQLAQELNAIGVDTMVMSTKPLRPQAAGAMLDCMLTSIEDAPGPTISVGDAYAQAEACMYRRGFRSELLSFALAGDPDLLLCTPASPPSARPVADTTTAPQPTTETTP